jgi:hypothetical protein
MSEIRANSITDAAGTGAPNFPNGLSGSGASLTSLPAGELTGALPALNGSALTNLPAPTSAQVGTATAGLAVGAVGSYALLQQLTPNTSRSPGGTLAGSSLSYAHCGGGGATSPSGTWMLAGQIPSTTVFANQTSVWLRIS